MPAIATEDYLTPTQAARALGVSAQRVVQLAEAGRLDCLRTPLGRLFDRRDVERLLAERRAHAAAATGA